MRKKLFAALAVAVVAVVAGYNVYSSQKSTTLSDLALANVEALAYDVNGESSTYKCIAPYTAACAYELGVRIPGYKQ